LTDGLEREDGRREEEMKPEVLSATSVKMVSHRHLRKLLAKRIDDYVEM
jgi:hypothetical protein